MYNIYNTYIGTEKGRFLRAMTVRFLLIDEKPTRAVPLQIG